MVTEFPRPFVLGCSGLLAITLLVMGAIGARALTSGSQAPARDSVAVTPTSMAAPASAAPADPASAASDAAPTARELRARLDKDLQMGRYAAFISDLDELLKVDPRAAQDRELRFAIVDNVLMRMMIGGGEQAERLFEIIHRRMGTTGIDILYELVTTRGTSLASKRAAELLRDESVRARGTPALRIAYDLRMAGCLDKPALFERARSDGDGRTLGQLQELNRECGRRNKSGCCLHNNPALRAAIDGLKSRLATQ